MFCMLQQLRGLTSVCVSDCAELEVYNAMATGVHSIRVHMDSWKFSFVRDVVKFMALLPQLETLAISSRQWRSKRSCFGKVCMELPCICDQRADAALGVWLLGCLPKIQNCGIEEVVPDNVYVDMDDGSEDEEPEASAQPAGPQQEGAAVAVQDGGNDNVGGGGDGDAAGGGGDGL